MTPGLTVLHAVLFALAHKGAHGHTSEAPWIIREPVPQEHRRTTNDRTGLPTFAEALDRLPAPIFDEDPRLTTLYWTAWRIAFDHLRNPEPGSGLPAPWIDEGFTDNIYQRDTCLMMLFARYAHHVFPFIRSLDNFYARQHEDGFICREINEASGQDYIFEHQRHTAGAPLFAWAEYEYYRVSGDGSRFRRVLPHLIRYFEWVEANRRSSHLDLYWNTNLGVGTDNAPREGAAWVDMSAQQALAADSIARIAGYLGDYDTAQRFRRRYEQIVAEINRRLWDPSDGFYYDIREDGAPVRVMTAAGFWPMLAGAVTEPDRAERLIAHLNNEDEFATPHPVPTLARNHPDFREEGAYYRGAVWPATNYIIIKGLDRIGRPDLARSLALGHLRRMYAVLTETGTIWENYAPLHDAPGRPARPEYVGTSGLTPIALMLEDVIGLHVDGRNGEVHWRISSRLRHGVRHLRVGGVNATMICLDRDSDRQPPRIFVEADGIFRLHVYWPGGHARRQFQTGSILWNTATTTPEPGAPPEPPPPPPQPDRKTGPPPLPPATEGPSQPPQQSTATNP